MEAPQATYELVNATTIRIISSQKAEWLQCEQGSFEDCLRLREEGASQEDTPHVYELMRRGRHTELVFQSPSEMMLLVRSLGSNQYSETQPAMFKRLWRKLIDAVRDYPLGAEDLQEVARIEMVNRWA